MRKRTLKIFVKGESKAHDLLFKYSSLGYLCWIDVYRNEHKPNPEDTVYRFGIKLGEKCLWYT